jgi:hypothetical protein
MKVSRADIVKNLPKKGFRKDKSGHHIYFYHEYRGQETGICTYISHSAKQRDISADILLMMRRQLRLDSAKQAADLMTCPMDGKSFNRILGGKNLLKSPTTEEGEKTDPV